MVTKEDVMKALKECLDPEIGVNVVDLGFIYEVKIDSKKVHIKMSLTTPACPLHSFIVQDIKNKVNELKDVEEVDVQLVWDPPWTVDRISEEVRKKLGI
jgi:metal-sulfur cluster biosynthetic enzyme